MIYEDTYFLNPQMALEEASKQNRWGENDYYLQACYYDGEIIESALSNLIHTSLDNLVEELAEGVYRIPTKLDFSGLDLSASLKLEILTNFNLSIEHAKNYREQYNKHYLEILRAQVLDQNEPLRFYLMASVSTQVMQYVAKSIADELKVQGYNVFFDLRAGAEDNDCLRNVLAFNPHAMITINHLNNAFLSPDVYNFVWYQDAMPALVSDAKLALRERDYIYSLVPSLDKLLEKKGVDYERQSFCLNNVIYKLDDTIKRENKIVFIGSSYSGMIPENQDFETAIEYITKIFFSEAKISDNTAEEISDKFDINEDFVKTKLIPFVVRDLSVIQLCRLKSEYSVEIYGHGWELYKEVVPFYKGPLPYGEEIAKVYNSAMYAFAPHQQYILQQRVLEASACGAIPIVYDCREIVDDSYEEAVVYFKTFEDLAKIMIREVPQKDFTRLLFENSYKKFVDKIIQRVEKERAK